MTKYIDGKKIAAEIKAELAVKVKLLKQKNIFLSLAVILVGDNSASKIYIKKKSEACQEIGVNSETYVLKSDISIEKLNALINHLNDRKDINGILVQLPLPKHISENQVIEMISAEKDVDAFCAVNTGKLMIGNYKFLPCTPAGIIEILRHEKIEISGKRCVIVGRSNIVGKPTAMLLLQNDGTITVCHRKTKNLKEICLNADILISAVGQAGFINKDMVKKGVVVIDVGINRDSNGKLCGDVCFEQVAKLASHITPVPGGVGPMTIAMLLKNTIKAACLQNQILRV
ncbi:MAG: bifunctional 5,10-methylenetetrahydrofolate dehydrogenase/5,10-methenyltetrahydrofolate cyclohydrolase [Oscillospiraceae bacterium]|nr:bifunctional 5,10-methylenetetrahydrofolate dehydrogenase/5,10-methenyltetrahydrofolate cyclohydrolase [Oscillospiraceae bacterium]